MRRPILLFFLATTLRAQDWPQWGRTSQHDGAAAVTANGLDRIEATIVIDPLAEDEKREDDDDLLVHYPVPLVDGDDLFLLEKGGVFVGHDVPQTESWSVKNVRRTASGYATRWMFTSDWMPPNGLALVPYSTTRSLLFRSSVPTPLTLRAFR